MLRAVGESLRGRDGKEGGDFSVLYAPCKNHVLLWIITILLVPLKTTLLNASLTAFQYSKFHMYYLNIPYYSSLGKYCPHIAIPGLLARLTTYSCTCLFGSQSQVVFQVNMHGIASIETPGIFCVLSFWYRKLIMRSFIFPTGQQQMLNSLCMYKPIFLPYKILSCLFHD